MKNIIILIALFLSFIEIYTNSYNIAVIENKTFLNGYNYLEPLITETISSALLSKGCIVNSEKKNKKDYTISGGFIANEETILISIELIQNGDIIKIITETLSLDKNIFNDIKSMVYVLIKDEIKKNKKVYLPQKIIDKQSENIKNNKSEFRILFSIGQTYTGLGFIFNKVNQNYDFDISSPNNRWRNFTSPYLRFELSQLKNMDYHGVFIDMILPVFIENKYFFDYSRCRMGYQYGYNKILFFYPGIDLLFLSYNKYSKDNVIDTQVSLFTAGLSFDIKLSPPKNRFMAEWGVSLFPPFVPNNNNYEDNMFLPFNINLNGKTKINNFLFPVSLRSGISYFNKKNDFGIFFLYSISTMYVEYKDILEYNLNIYDKTWDFGNEITFIHEFRIGIIYKQTIN